MKAASCCFKTRLSYKFPLLCVVSFYNLDESILFFGKMLL